ncbi:unnamed protein product [Diplocarpon coronariae]
MQASRVHVIGNSEGKDNSQDPIQQKKTEEMSGSDESSDEEKESSLRIGITGSGRPTCFCDEQRNCEHIMWLLVGGGQVNATPHEHITQMGLRKFWEELEWDLEARRQTKGLNRERIMIFRDILATFSDVETEKFRADIFDLRDDVNMEPILVSKDLEATVVRVLMKDDNFFPPFKNLVSHDIRAIAYFKKKRSCGVGRVAGHDNIVCSAQTLADTVSAISIHNEAAKALISAVSVVFRERNHDTYPNSPWPRRRPPGKQSNPSGGNFVIQALLDLPESLQFFEELEKYRNKLSRLIGQLKGGSDMSSSSERDQPAQLTETRSVWSELL